jgi:hypothetical protein
MADTQHLLKLPTIKLLADARDLRAGVEVQMDLAVTKRAAGIRHLFCSASFLSRSRAAACWR